MKKLTIEKIENAFNKFVDKKCRLKKVENFNRDTMVFTGDKIVGKLSMVDLFSKKDEMVGIMVDSGSRSDRSDWGMGYIRTSPVVKIIYSNEILVLFETQGGVYLLQKILPKKRFS